jgi:hypothetical protein
MKDTIFNGKKNNTYLKTIFHINRFNKNLRLSYCLWEAYQNQLPLPGKPGHWYIKDKLFFGSNGLILSSLCEVSSPCQGTGRGRQRLGLIQNQRRYYHISNIRAVNRIGPHNLDVNSVIIGSLMGKAIANKRSGEGVRICYRQSIRHKEYLFWLYTFFYNRGYTSNLQPRQSTRTIQTKEGKVYYGFEFNTFTFRSFSWIHNLFYNKGKKVVPLKIYEYLTPLALAV